MNRETTILKTDGLFLRLYPPIWFLLIAATFYRRSIA